MQIVAYAKNDHTQFAKNTLNSLTAGIINVALHSMCFFQKFTGISPKWPLQGARQSHTPRLREISWNIGKKEGLRVNVFLLFWKTQQRDVSSEEEKEDVSPQEGNNRGKNPDVFPQGRNNRGGDIFLLYSSG